MENCNQLEEIFDLEGLNVDGGHVGLLPKLEEMYLIGLPKLSHIWNKDPREILCFQNLKWLEVCECDSFRYAFPSSMASGSIGNIIFPKLTHISLEFLPRLTSFSPGYHTLQKLDHADLDIPFAMLFNERVSLSLRILFFLLVIILIFLLALFRIKLL